MQIYITGSMAYDRIMNFPGRFSDHILPDKIHILNVSFPVNGLEEKFGGTAGNIAYNLALLGEKPLILASAGKDFDRYADWMGKNGLPLEGIRVVDEEFTAGAYITTDQSDNQITGFNAGAMMHSCLYDFPGLDPDDSLAIISPGNVQDMIDHAEFYRDKGVRYIFDPGQQITVFPGEQLLAALTGSFMLISNDYELEMIIKATGASRDEILTRTQYLVTTLGEGGSAVRQGCEPGGKCEKKISVDAVKVERAVDPTGCGDAYRSGLLKGLADGLDVVSACRLGAVCASFCVEYKGTQEHSFDKSAVLARHSATFGQGRCGCE